jgi:hypothetical protein
VRRLSGACDARYNRAVRVNLEISAGELIDRITILELKRAHVTCESAHEEVTRQLMAARDELHRTIPPSPELLNLTAQLAAANHQLWRTEDELRECERSCEFGARFVNLARSVYKTNDLRSSLKGRIDELLGSDLREHKFYFSLRGAS